MPRAETSRHGWDRATPWRSSHDYERRGVARSQQRILRSTIIVAGLMVVTAFLWSTPFLWTLVASFRPEMAGGIGRASWVPDSVPTRATFMLALEGGDFGFSYFTPAMVALGFRGVQIVTISLGGYAFARLSFPG